MSRHASTEPQRRTPRGDVDVAVFAHSGFASVNIHGYAGRRPT